jgi:1-acyl-sn-glycerol-3-phosphate acyltransferase
VRWRSLTDPGDWAPIPTLMVANHTSWWDGFLSHELTRAMGRRFRILMEQEHLDRYRVLRRLGALPMERRSALQAMRDLKTAVGCLAADTQLWIYPQGARRPAGEPLERLEHGAAWMINHGPRPLRVVPVAFRYPFLSEQRPEAFALVGTPWIVDRPGTIDRPERTARIRAAIEETLAHLDGDLRVEELQGYASLLTGRLSLNNRLDRWRHRFGVLDDYRLRNG